mmetsp:Transcript_4629/g.6914  ORF Transcript_4629/g.6914 Transcript_4629/m.6914 type:complete len:257 (-) Transcript_4629:140-910(-)
MSFVRLSFAIALVPLRLIAYPIIRHGVRGRSVTVLPNAAARLLSYRCHSNSKGQVIVTAMNDYYKDASKDAKYKTSNGYDAEGFDPEADTVGAGIYGGRVKKDLKTGEIIWGKQYQNHNKAPGPIYDGSGYADIVTALREGKSAIDSVLKKDPNAVNEITTGGATPLHMCGMSYRGQMSTSYIISKGGKIEALDTYGYTPLHRMASNNLAIGAKALLDAGANPYKVTKYGEDALSIAISSSAHDVIKVLKDFAREA